MRKRQKMVITAVGLATALLAAQGANLEIRYLLVVLLTLVTWLLAAWTLKEGLTGLEWLTIPLPAALFTAATGLFYILLPQAWWARGTITVFFAIGQYALLLTGNIFSVASIRTIALFRAASTVGFVMSLVTAFLLFDTIWSFRPDWWQVYLLVFAASVVILLPAVWSVDLPKKLDKRLLSYCLWPAGAMGTLALAVTFWPISISVASLFLTTTLYVFLGIIQHQLTDRLFTRTMGEYVTVGIAVTITMLLTAGWGI